MSKAFITATLNPISQKRVHAIIPGSGRLSDHMAVPDGAVIYKNGRPYADQELFPGDLINITVAPKGGDSGKDIARTGIVLAAQVAAAVATQGLSTWAQIGIRAGVTIVASLGANALIPPPSPNATLGQEGGQFNRLGSLTGTRNRYQPYTTVPRVYGKRKVFPPMSARPYTEVEGNDQYQRLLFCLGAGPLRLSVPKIGDTVIGSLDNNNVFTSNDAFSNIEIEVAEQPDLYSTQVEQSDPSGTFEDDGDVITRTTADNADEIGVDITFPQGLFVASQNTNINIHAVDFKIEYREVGQSSWTELEGDTPAGSRGSSSFGWRGSPPAWRALSGKRETLRVSKSWKVDKGQYEVRITRLSAREQDEDSQVFESANWTALKTIRYEKPTNMPGVVQLAMRVKATDQINGVLDNFSVEVESRLPYYDGTQWQEVTFDPETGNGTGGKITSNPAWILADILCGSDNARPLDRSRLNASEFKNFADNCETEGRLCNIVIDGQRTLRQTLMMVGSAGRGSIALHDELYTVVQDTEQATPVQHFTNRNSWDFSSTRSFPDVPHALRINFVNPDADWETDEVTVYDDGYSFDGTNCRFDDGSGVCKVATKFETLDLEGVTSYEQAWKEGRYRLAEMRLRPERYTFMADCENLVCQRGDLIYATHDVPLWGLYAGRIKSIDGTTLAVDEKITMEAGKDYTLRVRNKAGVSVVKEVATAPGSTNEITVNNTTDIAAGDLFMFGEVGKETTPLKVLSIEPQGDLSARITAVDAASEIYEADTGTIPDFDTNISVPPVDPDTIPPPAPIITNVRSESSALYTDVLGNPILRLMVSYRVGDGSPTEFVDAEYRKVGDDAGWVAFSTGGPATGIIYLENVERGAQYIIRVRARRGQLTSLWVQSNTHTAGGKIEVPGRPDKAIGSITQDLDGTYTSISVNLLTKVRKGIDFNIKNELERDLIPITPTIDAGPGEVVMQIEEQFIQAPSGSYIFKSPHQEEGETIDVPGFDFVGDTLAVIGDELAATMDLIANGVDFGKVAKDQLNEAGEVLVESFNGTLDEISDGVNYGRVAIDSLTAAGIVLVDSLEGTLDNLSDGVTYARTATGALDSAGLVLVSSLQGTLDDMDDGTTYARVKNSSLTTDGLVLLSVAIGDLDDISDGAVYGRVDQAALTAQGLVLLSGTIGDIDDIADGTGFGKVDKASLTASGLVLLSQTSGTLDDVDDGASFQRVASAQLSAGGLVLLSEVEGNLDDIDDGTSFGKIQKSSLTASGLVLLSGTSGDLDDIDDGENFQRVASASLSASGLVLLSASEGTLDDIQDGTTYGRIEQASLSASGLVLVSALSGDIDDLEDGTTFGKIKKASLTVDGLVLLSETSGSLDDVQDGGTYQRVQSAALTTGGLVLMDMVSGDLDDVDDGSSFGRIQKASLTPAGLVLLSGTSGDLDDISDGDNFQRVSSANLSASGLVLLSASQGTIDDIADGTTYGRIEQASLSASGLVLISALSGTIDDLEDGDTYGRVNKAALDSNGLVISSSGFDGDLDDIDDGATYQRVQSAALTAAGLVILDVVSGTLDDVDDGSSFGKVQKASLTAAGLVLVDGLSGNLDDLSDGTNFQRVASANLNASGLVLLSASQGTLDDIDDGSTYGRIDKASLTAGGLVIISALSGDIDDITDGDTFGKVQKASLTAGGLVLLSGASGTLDDIDDGTTYSKVQTASLTATGLVLLSAADGTLDDIDDGTTYGRITSASLTSGGLVLVSGLSGTLDDLSDGTNFQRVASASLTAGGLVILSAVDGTLDDVDDGTTFGKVDRAALTASGLVLLSAASGDLDDLQDGSTYERVLATEVAAGHIKIIGPDGQTVIDQGQIYTDEIFASAADITNTLTMGADGHITNTTDDFDISDEGIVIAPRESIFNTSIDRSLFFRRQNGTELAMIQGVNDVTNSESWFELHTNEDMIFDFDNGAQWFLQGLPTSAGGGSGARVWLDGATLKYS